MDKSVNLTKQQQNVLSAKNRDILVAASAGSGKTFVVVERIISRTINDGIDIDKILVVTFTNAAAAELKERIINRFYELLKSNDISNEKKENIHRQLTLINRAQISTIHSFCLSVIKNNFFEIDIDPNVKTLDENKAKILLMDSIAEIIEEEYELKSEMFLNVLNMFGSEDKIVTCLERIYDFSRSLVDVETWFDEALNRYSIDNNINDLTDLNFGKQIVSDILEKLDVICSELSNVCEKIRFDSEFESRLSVFESIIEKIESIKKVTEYDKLYCMLQNLLPFPRLPSSKCSNDILKKEVSNVKDKASNDIKDILKIAYKDTKGIIQDLNSMYNVTEWFKDLVIKIDNRYSDKKNLIGQIDFADYEHLALKVLENESICKMYREKFLEIYVDEYQDTSYIQEKIIEKISSNNRIMVGDVKQSIYSFRNAEPKLFNEKYTLYKKYEDVKDKNIPTRIMLPQNFRSRAEILNGINYIFGKIMSKSVGECDYNNDEYLLYGNGYDVNYEQDYSIEINVVESTQKQDEKTDEVSSEVDEITNTEKEAYEVADKIRELIKNEYKVYDLKTKKYRNIEYKDIVILMRSASSKSSIYEKILKSKNIPAFCDTQDSFYNSEEVSIIISVLKLIDNVYDDIALVSVMYSIIGKFTADELVFLRRYNKAGYFYDAIQSAYLDKNNKKRELFEKLDNFMKLLDKLNLYMNTYSIAETILKIYEDTGIYYSFYLEELGRQKCANLDKLVEFARNFEKEGKSSLYQFIQYIESMKEKKGTDTPKLLGEGENVVRILTIHKSKGLEYPVVFLVDTSKKYNIQDSVADILLSEDYGIGMDIYDLNIGISYSSIIKQAIKENIKNKLLSEEERLLYVAMTRAKEKLYIYGSVKNYEKYMEKFNFEDTKISPSYVKTCNSYLNLLMCAKSGTSNQNIKVNVIVENDSNNKSINSDYIDRNMGIKDKFIHVCKENNIKKIANTAHEFEEEYTYLDSRNLKKKYSVTEIKNGVKIDEENEKNIIESSMSNDISLEFLKPKCIENTKLSGTDYGSIIHRILENIDYFSVDMEKIYNSIVMEFRNAQNINANYILNKIEKYLSSDIKKYIQNAKAIKKEQPFVIYDKLDDSSEDTYIQGVIDLLIETKNEENIIVDFKTDKVKSAKELLDKYSGQLLTYKRGIELSSEKKINDMFIYSFYLDELIKIDV